MVNRDAIENEVRERIAEVRARIDGQSEGHKRWNRLEEAMDTIGEDAISVLDDVGRYDQANEISSMLAAHERYDALLAIFKNDAALATEARAADREAAYERSKRFLEALAPIAAIEIKNRPF